MQSKTVFVWTGCAVALVTQYQEDGHYELIYD